jgi:DNA-binding transcriptional ArsR family regulator
VLRNAGMVRTERQSQTVYYSLAPGFVTRLLAVLHAEFCSL